MEIFGLVLGKYTERMLTVQLVAQQQHAVMFFAGLVFL